MRQIIIGDIHGCSDKLSALMDKVSPSDGDRLIFLGWNSMTDEIMDKLTAYVEQGGHLLMTSITSCLLHLSQTSVRTTCVIVNHRDKIAKELVEAPVGDGFGTVVRSGFAPSADVVVLEERYALVVHVDIIEEYTPAHHR